MADAKTGQCIRIFTLIGEAFDKINDLPKGKGLLFAPVVCVVIAVVLIVVYAVLIIKNLLKISKNKTVLNIESIQYASIYSLSFVNNGKFSFNYAYFFVILLGLAFVSLIIYMGVSSKEDPADKVSVLVPVIALGVAIALQLTTMILAGKDIDKVKKKADNLNTYICTNMYKKQEFLDKLKASAGGKINTHYTTIIECIGLLKKTKNINSNKLAKAFYTLTIYNYFNEFTSTKMGSSKGAYDMFNMIALSDKKKPCQPVGYLPRYGTFIEDIGETIIRQNMPYSQLLNDAMIKCDEMVATTNKLANEIYPDVAFNVFIVMFIATIVINVMLVGTVFYYSILPKTDDPAINA